MGEIIFHIVFMLIFGVFLNSTFAINTKRMVDSIGPAGFPRFIIILGLILLAISLYQAIKKYMQKKDKTMGKIEELNVTFIGILASVIVFVIAISYIGFILSAVVFLMVILLLLGERRKGIIIMYSLIGAVVFTLMFGRVLTVPLPRGLGILEQISYILY